MRPIASASLSSLNNPPVHKPVISPRGIVIWFFIVLALYLGVFYGIEGWRTRHGPWTVRFLTDGQGRPAIAVTQAKLGVQSLRIDFAGEHLPMTNLDTSVSFRRPLIPLPFGRRLHEDLVSFPGVETIDFFGHEVELLPRTLKVNRREIPWTSTQSIELWPSNKFVRKP